MVRQYSRNALSAMLIQRIMKNFFVTKTLVLTLVLSTISLFTFSQPGNQGSVITPDNFPANAIWLNTEFALSMENMKEKVTVIAIMDEHSIECGYFMNLLREKVKGISAIQIVQVMQGDARSPVSKNHLLQYIQKNGYMHPIAIVSDFSTFPNATIDRAPYFMLYEKAAVPALKGSGLDGFTALSKRIDFLKEDKTLFSTCMTHQFRAAMEPGWWANPVIETPTYIAGEEGGENLFINDAAHHRLLRLDDQGAVSLMLGSMLPGYNDESMYTSSFNHPHGMVHSDNKLFIADTYNNRIRVVDFASEKVSTLSGNGYITFKKAKAVDSKFEPLGLPVDITVLGNNLYVASAATNQIFEVNMRDGSANAFCDLPENMVGVLKNCPININSGANTLYVTMADGQAYAIDRKGKIEPIDKKNTYRFTSVTPWKNGLVGITWDGFVVYQEEGKWSVIGGTDAKEKKNLFKLNYPTDALNMNGDLLITDTDNHRIKQLDSPSDKMLKNYWLKVSMELIGFEPAHTNGEIVLMDTIFVSSGEVTMNVILDLEGYKVLPAGQNELVLHDITGKTSLGSETITKEEFKVKVKSDYPDPDVYMEIYITMEDPENPGLFLIKRAYLDFPVAQIPKAESVQEQIYKPSLLPF